MTMTANLKELKSHLSDAQCLLDELKECQAILKATFHALHDLNNPKEASFLPGLYQRQSSDDIGEIEYHFEQMKTYLGD